LAVVGTALGVLALPGAASAATAQKKPLAPLQLGMTFYKGKTITLISPDAPGGGFDDVARIVAPLMGQYLGATVNVENDAPATTIAGQDLMEASTPNGLTVGMINAGADIEDIVTHSPGVNFNPQKTQFLGGNGPAGGGGISCLTSSGLTSFSQLVHSATPITEVVVSTGAATLTLDLENASFGIKNKLIAGFIATAPAVAGFEAGDAECSAYSVGNGLGSFMAAGKAHLLLDLYPANPAIAFYQQTTTALPLATAFKQFPATTRTERLARSALQFVVARGVGHEFNAPAKTPPAEVAALRAAIKFALTNPTAENKELALGQGVGWVTGPRALADYKNELAALKPVASLISTALGA
jgi:hypothetical protein